MTGTQEARVTVRPDSDGSYFDGSYFDGSYFDGMAWDLATVSGALSEIATTWRRALPGRPDLPLELPQRLADMARRLAADIRSLAGERERAPDLVREMTIRMSVLSQGVDYARAITSRGGVTEVADAPLWELLRPALRRTDRTFTRGLATV